MYVHRRNSTLCLSGCSALSTWLLGPHPGASARQVVRGRVHGRPPGRRFIALGWALLVLLLGEFDLPPAAALPFQEGEELTFEISWLGMSVGTATLSIGQHT